MSQPNSDDRAESRPDVSIERLVPGGHGFARLPGGKALLVPGALPGDRVRVIKHKEAGGIETVLEWEFSVKSPDRVTPVCEVQEVCGGCDLMGLSAEAQVRAKLGLLGDALVRVARLEPRYTPTQLVSAGPVLGYRSRIRLQVERGHIGFFQRGSHDLVEPQRCHVALPELETTLAELRRLARRRADALAAFAFVELCASSSGVSLYFSLKPGIAWVPAQSQSLLRELGRRHVVATSSDRQASALERFQLSDEVYSYAAPGAFTQVNRAVNRLLVERVADLAEAENAADFVDLYAGSGNFSLLLLKRGLAGVAVEADRVAILAATKAAREQGLGGRFVVDDAAKYASRAQREGRQVDLVLVDPPRAGVKHALAQMASLARLHVALVSCDPVTFARDLRGFMDNGFALRHLEAFDMFPQTHHVECLAWLNRVV